MPLTATISSVGLTRTESMRARSSRTTNSRPETLRLGDGGTPKKAVAARSKVRKAGARRRRGAPRRGAPGRDFGLPNVHEDVAAGARWRPERRAHVRVAGDEIPDVA